MAGFSIMTFDDEDDDHEEIHSPLNLQQEQRQRNMSTGTNDLLLKNDSGENEIQTVDKGSNNYNYATGIDNPAYRPFHTLPYTDFMKPGETDTPIVTEDHLVFPNRNLATGNSHTGHRNNGPKHNTYSKSNGHAIHIKSRRKKNQRSYYYHDNYHSHKNGGTAQKYIGRRLGPHHKYATTRHSPILAYNNTSRLLLANGDIRKSQSLGQSSAQKLYHEHTPATLVPTHVIYTQAPFFQDPSTQTAPHDPSLAQLPHDRSNGVPVFRRQPRAQEGERGEGGGGEGEAEEGRSRHESHSTEGLSSVGKGAILNFLRHPKSGRLLDKKESCVSFFDIETDKVSSYMYRPGEEVSGSVTLIVRHTMEIRFVELVVTGRGHVTLRRSEGRAVGGDMGGWLARSAKETYLYKRTYVIGTGDEAWSSLLTPGTYTSKFRVKLPKGLPSSLKYEDASNGVSLEVNYHLKARICDDPGPSASVRSRLSTRSQQHGQLVRVLMSKQINFNVQRSFDISTISRASEPFSHTEQLFMSCAHNDAAIVTVNLDRSVFLAGDDVKLQLTTSLPSSQRVKEISCSLQEHVSLDPKREPVTISLTRMLRKDPGYLGSPTANHVGQEKDAFEVTIPTQTDLVSPFSLGSSKAKIAYSLAIALKFSRSGGKLSFKVPLTIGPCAEPIYAEKTSSRKIVPVFNRPTRFPHFSSPIVKQPISQSPLAAPSHKGWAKSPSVQSKYSNSCWSRLFLCCSATTD